MISKAIASLRCNGMTEITKQHFADAIKLADAGFGPSNLRDTQIALSNLTLGTRIDGTILSEPEIMATHAFVDKQFDLAVMGNSVRELYAKSLTEAKQFSSAEKVYKENVQVADKLPLDLGAR